MATIVTPRAAPGIRQLLPLPYGALAKSRRDPLGFLMGGMTRYGDVFRYQLGPLVFHVVAHPDHVRHVLLDNQRNYPRSWYYDRTKAVLGEGLVTTEGTAWRRLRRMAQPAFQHHRVAAFAATMTDATAGMLVRWRDHAQSETPLDVAAEFVRLTLRIVGRTLLSIELDGDANRIGQAVTESIEFLDHRINALIALPMSVPTSTNRRARRALKTLDTIVYDIISQRRREGSPEGADLLSMLLATRDEETGEGLTDVELRDQIITFIGAGHETTAVALAWTLYLLAQHPDAETLVCDEVVRALNGRPPTADDMPKLEYTRRVIEESLRLYPPVFAIIRDVKAADEIAGFRIPARSMIVLSPFVTHHHPDVWPDPERFDPDRFLPEQTARRPRFAWYPFLGGPHQCIGQEFAMMEMTLVIAMIVQAFRFRLAPGARVEPAPMLSLRQRHGVSMLLAETADS